MPPFCPKCGASLADPNAQFCPSCGASLTQASYTPEPATAPATPPPAYSGYLEEPSGILGPRPTGITILAILEVLGGLAFLLGGAALAAFGSFAGGYAGLAVGLGVVLLIFGLASFAVAYGLWTGMGWAWLVALVLSGLGALVSLISIATGLGFGSIVSLIIDGIIIYYLTRPHVKAYFGK